MKGKNTNNKNNTNRLGKYIYKTPNGTYRVRITVAGVRKSKNFTKITAARTWRDTMLAR